MGEHSSCATFAGQQYPPLMVRLGAMFVGGSCLDFIYYILTHTRITRNGRRNITPPFELSLYATCCWDRIYQTRRSDNTIYNLSLPLVVHEGRCSFFLLPLNHFIYIGVFYALQRAWGVLAQFGLIDGIGLEMDDGRTKVLGG